MIGLILAKFNNRLEEKSLIDKIGSIYEGLDVKNRGAMYYNVVFVLRRQIFALTAVFVSEYSFFQI